MEDLIKDSTNGIEIRSILAERKRVITGAG